mmetsp:Transcript_20080/g.47296  ORF Transcript_20080/g.47296 Transcript_20080/m.47296 type:complete len:361 (+) Transcript_20080:113-1195(+)
MWRLLAPCFVVLDAVLALRIGQPLALTRGAAAEGGAGAELVDAWLHMSHAAQKLEGNMYAPVLASLQDALGKLGTTTRIIDRHSDADMVEGVRSAVARQRWPLVVDVAIKFGTKSSMRALKACHEAGAYLVLYSTEAADADWMSNATARLGADEVWEYALSNIDRYSKEFRSKVPVRYLPPGYSPQLVSGVDVRSPDRQVAAVGFMGGFGYRPKAIRDMYRSMLGPRLVTTGTVWSKEEVRQYLNRLPLQLNLHKEQTCCPHNPEEPVAMEAFRMAVLLANGACVVSTPVPEKDMRIWDGIVHFAEPDKTLQVLEGLQRDVLGCQEKAAQLYRRRFDPERLMQASGFLDAWRPRGLKGGL